MSVEMIQNAQNIVGESLVWDDRRHCLVWIDIISKRIHTLDPATRVYRSWPTPDFVTSIGLCVDGDAIVGLTKAICSWDYGSEFNLIAEIESEKPGNRLNEGVVGPDGAFWVGTMQNNIAPDGSPVDITSHTGQLYRCLADGAVETVSSDLFGITNTFVWPDNRTLITADTLKNEIYRYSVDPRNGQLSDRTIINSGIERGLPDGSCRDAEGYIWNCRVVGGACLIRFDPEGRIDRTVELPCSWPTSCTFGGENLDRLFVTSARFTMSEEHLVTNPQEGGVFAVDVGCVGLPANRFG